MTVQFKDAALKLTVTPQITAANTVIMKIDARERTPDFSRAVNGNPSINTQTRDHAGAGGRRRDDRHRRHRAEHRDASHTTRRRASASMPLLGWLFRHDTNESSNQELLIFITPRIIR